MIKHLTFSALTGGAMVLAYAAWSKWRSAPSELEGAAPAELDPAPEAPSVADAEPLSDARAVSDAESIDVILDDLWDADESIQNPDEQLVDFSSELSYDDEEGAVAPEGLGVRWLTRATAAMSPFHHALTVREEAEAALLDGVAVSRVGKQG